MLVLSRKEQEKLVIDGNIVITVVRITGGVVRIGIEAPPKISIRREELPQRPQLQRPESHSAAPRLQQSAVCLAPLT